MHIEGVKYDHHLIDVLATVVFDDKPNPVWTVAVAAVPALITLVGTVWQVGAHRSKARATLPPWPADQQVQVLRVTTDRPATTIDPASARVMVIWHLVVAGVLLLIWLHPFAQLPFVSLPFLLPMAVLYLLGAAFYAWKYLTNHAMGVLPSAELLVEGDGEALRGRLMASLASIGAEVAAFDFTDPANARVTARTGGASITAVTAAGENRRFLIRVEGTATRRVDGLPRARRRVDDFVKVFLGG